MTKTVAAALVAIIGACGDSQAPVGGDVTGVFAGEVQNPSSPQCLRIVIHPVSNALGVMGNGLFVQGLFLDCSTGTLVTNQFIGSGRMLAPNHVHFDVSLSVNPPGGVPPLYRIDLVRQDSELIGTWGAAGNNAPSPISVRLRVANLNTSGLAGHYVITSVNAPAGYPVEFPFDTLELAIPGSAYHARCGGATLAEYNRTGDAVTLRKYFNPCPYGVPYDTLLIRGANLVRRHVYIRVTDPTLRDTVEEVYVRR